MTLPEFPAGQVAVLATVGADGPVPIPVSAIHRVDDHRLLLALGRRRATLTRLRAEPRVGLSLSGPAFSVSAVGRARVVADPLPGAAHVAAVLVQVSAAWDARGAATEVEAGIEWRWTAPDAAGRHAVVLHALSRVAEHDLRDAP